jgi:hypothetical protein
MKIWFQKNYKLVITLAFLVPIITVAIVSISHVTRWYGLTNPVSWAIYLSVGIEIAALSSLAAISVDMGRKVYFPFGIATLIQLIGNVFFAYSYIDSSNEMFKSWVELSSPIVSMFGVESTDIIANKRFLAFFAGGMLPVISLSFLHMLIRFTEEENKKKQSEVGTTEVVSPVTPVLTMEEVMSELSKVRTTDDEPKVTETTTEVTDPSFIMSELSRIRPTEEQLKKLESILTTKSKDSIDDDIDVDYVGYPDELEELENETESESDNNPNDDNVEEELSDLLPEEESRIINEATKEESLWKQVMKKHQERIDNGENFDDEPSSFANSGRTEKLDESGIPLVAESELIGDKSYGTDPDPDHLFPPEVVVTEDMINELENKKKILDLSNEEVISTLPINEGQSLPKSGNASIIDPKIYG